MATSEFTPKDFENISLDAVEIKPADFEKDPQDAPFSPADFEGFEPQDINLPAAPQPPINQPTKPGQFTIGAMSPAAPRVTKETESNLAEYEAEKLLKTLPPPKLEEIAALRKRLDSITPFMTLDATHPDYDPTPDSETLTKNRLRVLANRYLSFAEAPATFKGGVTKAMSGEGGAVKAIPFAGALASIPDKLIRNEILDKFARGEKLTEHEDAVVDALALAARRQVQDPAFWESVGGLTAESLPYAMEFAATGGAYSAAKGALGKALIARGWGKGVQAVAPRLAGVAAQTAVSSAPRAGSQFLDNMAKEWGVDPESLETFIADEQEDKNWMKELTRAGADQYLENLSERTGRFVGKAIPKEFFVKLFRLGALREWMARTGETSVGKAAAEARKAFQFAGTLEEVGEEYIGSALKSLTGVDEQNNAARKLLEEGDVAGAASAMLNSLPVKETPAMLVSFGLIPATEATLKGGVALGGSLRKKSRPATQGEPDATATKSVEGSVRIQPERTPQVGQEESAPSPGDSTAGATGQSGKEAKQPAEGQESARRPIDDSFVEEAINGFLDRNGLPRNIWNADQRQMVKDALNEAFNAQANHPEWGQESLPKDPFIVGAQMDLPPVVAWLKAVGLLPKDFVPKMEKRRKEQEGRGYGSSLRKPTEEEQAERNKRLGLESNFPTGRQRPPNEVVQRWLENNLREQRPIPSDLYREFIANNASMMALANSMQFQLSDDGQWFVSQLKPFSKPPDDESIGGFTTLPKGSEAPVVFERVDPNNPGVGWFRITKPFVSPESGNVVQPSATALVNSKQLEKWGYEVPKVEREKFEKASSPNARQGEPGVATSGGQPASTASGAARQAAREKGVHPNSIKKLDELVFSKDVVQLAGILHPDNKNLRAIFSEEQGVTLPNTVSGTRQAVEQWANRAVSDAQLPNPELEKKYLAGWTVMQLDDKQLREEWLRIGGNPKKVKAATNRGQLMDGIRAQIAFNESVNSDPSLFKPSSLPQPTKDIKSAIETIRAATTEEEATKALGAAVIVAKNSKEIAQAREAYDQQKAKLTQKAPSEASEQKPVDLGNGMELVQTDDGEQSKNWVIRGLTGVLGNIQLSKFEDTGKWHVSSISVPYARGAGLGRKATIEVAKQLGQPIYSDVTLSEDGKKAWEAIATDRETLADGNQYFVYDPAKPAGKGDYTLYQKIDAFGTLRYIAAGREEHGIHQTAKNEGWHVVSKNLSREEAFANRDALNTEQDESAQKPRKPSGSSLRKKKPAASDKEKKAPAAPKKKEWKLLGKNADGNDVFEDENGIRSFVENGIRITEPVEMIPTKSGIQVARGGTEDSRYDVVPEQAPAQQQDGFWVVIPPTAFTPDALWEGPWPTREEAQRFIDAEVGGGKVEIVEIRNGKQVKAEAAPKTPAEILQSGRGAVLPEQQKGIDQLVKLTGEDARDPRMDEPGITRAAHPNSIVIQLRDKRSVPLREFVIAPSGDAATDAANVQKRIESEAAADSSVSIRESMGTLTDERGHGITRFATSPGGPLWASVRGLIEARKTGTAKAVREAPKTEVKSPLSNLSADDQAEAERLKAELRKMLGRTNMGVDPDILTVAVKLANLYVKGGTKTFQQYAKSVKEDLPDIWDAIKIYLRNVWNQIADMVGLQEVSKAEADSVFAELDKPAEKPTLEKESNEQPETQQTTPTPTESGQRPVVPKPADLDEGQSTRPTSRPGADAGQTGGGGGRGGAVSKPDISPDAEEQGAAGSGAGSGTESTVPAAKPARKPTPDKRQGMGEDQGVGENLVITKDDEIVPKTRSARIAANIRAIKLSKKLAQENRLPNNSEKRILMQYSGWGDTFQALGMTQVASHYTAAEVADESQDGTPVYNILYREDDRTKYENWRKQYFETYQQLKAALTPEEFESAKVSSLNAHYTSREVVESMWDIVKRLGFKGGVAVEPSAGIGHFIGLTPEEVRGKTHWVAIELDKTTGQMLKQLYPKADVQITGFEDSLRTENNSADLVISNFPFGDYQVVDTEHPDYDGWSIHNYFTARSIDVVKPGGLVVAITSHFTMDSTKNRKMREWLAKRAELLGAIRLPNTAFKANAGTEVVTDILVFRKKAGINTLLGQRFTNLANVAVAKEDMPKQQEDESDEAYQARLQTKPAINEYFVNHPEMVLGRHALTGSMHGGNEYTVVSDAKEPIGKQIEAVIRNLPENVALNDESTAEAAAQEAASFKTAQGQKPGRYVIDDGKIHQVDEQGRLIPQSFSSVQAARVKKLIAIRDATTELISKENSEEATDEEIEQARRELNNLYDQYHKAYGALNETSVIDDDPEWPLLASLEDEEREPIEVTGKNGVKKTQFIAKYKKGPMLLRRINFPRIEPKVAENLQDAVSISINYRGSISPEYVAKLLDITPEDARKRILTEQLAFQNPETGLLDPPDLYLSGFVKTKLAAAQKAAEKDESYKRNVEALQKVIPPPLPAEKIFFRLGANWIPTGMVKRFLNSVLEVNTEVEFHRVDDETRWSVELLGGSSTANSDEWGISPNRDDGAPGVMGHELVQDLLNLKLTEVYKYVEDSSGKRIKIDYPKQTAAARDMQGKLQDRFREWVLSVSTEAKEIEDIYNRLFNGMVRREYPVPQIDRFPGASVLVDLRDWQKRGAARSVQEGTLLAHMVGTGKTYTLITTAMEMRRLGTARKPMIVLQNSTLSQFAASFRRLYPTANILVGNEKQTKPENRKAFVAKLTTRDWDAVLIPHSFFERIQNDPQREANYVQERLDELDDAIRRAEGANYDPRKRPKTSLGKQLVKAKKRFEAKMKRILERMAAKTDDVVTFEQLGVDALLVDEAHTFKRGDFYTKMDRIKGLDTNGSDKSMDFLLKTMFIHERSPDRNVVLATGTPISNTLAEMWTMLRYIRPQLLKDFHVDTFDDFVGSFAKTVASLEETPTGGFAQTIRLARYINGPEIGNFWRAAADVYVLSDEDIAKLKLKVPKMEGGAPKEVVLERSESLGRFIDFLRDWRFWWENLKGKDKAEMTWVPIVQYTLARKAAIDLRLVNPKFEDDPDSKTNRVVRDAFELWKSTADVSGTQLIFSALYQSHDPNKAFLDSEEHLPNPLYKVAPFSLFEDMKNKLVAMGVPEAEIADFTNKSEAERTAMAEQLKAGKIRIAFGTTESLGTGLNIQDHIVAVVQMDPQFRPMDFAQRVGRAIRQGNLNEVVKVLVYGVKRTMDSTLYQLMLIKQKFIAQMITADNLSREFEDPADESTLGFQAMSAAFSGNPLFAQRFALENDVRMLQIHEETYARKRSQLRSKLTEVNEGEHKFNDVVAAHEKTVAAMEKAFGERKIKSITYKNETVEGDDAKKRLGELMEEKLAEMEGNLNAEFSSGELERTHAVKLKEAKRGYRVDPITRTRTLNLDINGIPFEINLYAEVDLNALAATNSLRIEKRGKWELKGYHMANISPWSPWFSHVKPIQGNAVNGGAFQTSLWGELDDLKTQSERIAPGREKFIKERTDITKELEKPFEMANRLKEQTEKLAEVIKELEASGADVSKDQQPPTIPEIAQKFPEFAYLTKQVVSEGMTAALQQIREDEAKKAASLFFRFTDGFKPVKGASAIELKDAGNLKFFIFQDKSTKEFSIIETSSGLRVAHGTNEEVTINKANEFIAEHGVQNVQKRVRDAVLKNGLSPRVKAEDALNQALRDQYQTGAVVKFQWDDNTYFGVIKELMPQSAEVGVEIEDGRTLVVPMRYAEFPSSQELTDYKARRDAGGEAIPSQGWTESPGTETQADTSYNEIIGDGISANELLNRLEADADSAFEYALIQKLKSLGLKTNVRLGTQNEASQRGRALASGVYLPDADEVVLFPASVNQRKTALHELVHAATVEVLDTDPALRVELEKLLAEAKQFLGAQHYGLTNTREFVTEAFTNPEFQKALNDVGKPKSLWKRFISWLRRVLGLAEREEGLLERVIRLVSPKMRAKQGVSAGGQYFEESQKIQIHGEDVKVFSARKLDPDAGRRAALKMFSDAGFPDAEIGDDNRVHLGDESTPGIYNEQAKRLLGATRGIMNIVSAQHQAGAPASDFMVNFLDSVRLLAERMMSNLRAGEDTSINDPELLRDLLVAAHEPLRIAGQTLQQVAVANQEFIIRLQNVDAVLQGILGERHGGDIVRDVLERVLAAHRDYFTPEEVRRILQEPETAKMFEEVEKMLSVIRQRDRGSKVYRMAQRRLKPKVAKRIESLERDALVREAVEQIIENAKAAGVNEPESKTKPLTPLQKLLVMVRPETAPAIDEAIDLAIWQAERNAARPLAAKELSEAELVAYDARTSDPDVEGPDPTPEEVEKGLNSPKFAHWRKIRDNLLGYSPVTDNLVGKLLRDDFKGVRNLSSKPKPKKVQIDLNALAQDLNSEVQRVMSEYLENLESLMALEGASDATRTRVVEQITERVEEQLRAAKKRVRDRILELQPKRGEAASKELNLLRKLNAELFSDPRLDVAEVVARAAKSSVVQRLLPGMAEMVQRVLTTPVLERGQMAENFAEKLVNDYGIDDAQAERAKEVFRRAFEEKLQEAEKRALEKAQAALTPQQREVAGPKTHLWRKIAEAVTAGVWDDFNILRKIAGSQGHHISDADIAKMKQLVAREQELRTLTDKQKRELAAAGITEERIRLYDATGRGLTQKEVEQLRDARVVAESSRSADRDKIHQEILVLWAKLHEPVTVKSAEGRRNMIRAVNEIAPLNLLFRLTFATVQGLDILTQGIAHNFTTAMAHASKRASLLSDQGRGGILPWLNEYLQAIVEATALELKVAKDGLNAVRLGMREGKGLPQRIEGISTNVHAIERAALKGKELLAQGKIVKALPLIIGSKIKLGIQWAASLDTFQSSVQRFPELRGMVKTWLLQNSDLNRAEVDIYTDEIMGDMRAELALARRLAPEILQESGIKTSKPALSVAAYNIVFGRILERARRSIIGPAEVARMEREIARRMQTLGWNQPENSWTGKIIARPLKGIEEGLIKAYIPSGPLTAFGNAMSIALTQKLQYTPLGFIPGAFEGSPTAESELDRAQVRARAAVGVAMAMPFVVAILNGAVVVITRWPDDKEERAKMEAAGLKPGTMLIPIGDDEFFGVSLTAGPLALVSPALIAAAEIRNTVVKHRKAQQALDEEAAKKGLVAGKAQGWTYREMLSVALSTAWHAASGSRTASGKLGSYQDAGEVFSNKSIARYISAFLPGVPLYQDAMGLAGVDIDPRLASVNQLIIPTPESGARRLNLFGEPVTKLGDVQNIIMRLTRGTGAVVSEDDLRLNTAYANVFATGYTPPPIQPNKGYNFGGVLRPMSQDELAKYSELRGRYFGEELSSLGELDNSTESIKKAQAAYQRANTRALSDVGVNITQKKAAVVTPAVNRQAARPQVGSYTPLSAPRAPYRISGPSLRRSSRGGRRRIWRRSSVRGYRRTPSLRRGRSFRLRKPTPARRFRSSLRLRKA